MAAASAPSRNRRSGVPAADSDSDSDDSYVPYVPVAQRRAQRLGQLQQAAQGQREAELAQRVQDDRRIEDEVRDKMTELAQQSLPAARRDNRSLLDINMELLKERGGEAMSQAEKEAEEERFLLAHINNDRVPLMGAKQNAKGFTFDEVMETGWRPPRRIAQLDEKAQRRIREKFSIDTSGEDLPPPIRKFAQMRFPRPILEALAAKNITRPSPIQVQGLPTVLAGRDMIGIAFTGSGKTLVFTLPMVMFALREEMRLPLTRGEGPIGMVIVPSRELARQTWEVAQHFIDHLARAPGFPKLRNLLCTGGLDMREQADALNNGVHTLCATPGRLLSMLSEKNNPRINLLSCKFLAMDEADRLIDLGFEEDIRAILDFFKYQRQTVLFSATMPAKIQEFALSALVRPVVVNVGRAGAANLDVIQEVEYVKQEARIVYLLECLQKTPPPVLIFSSNQADVDDIHEYLLLKGVDAVAIHGGKPQDERTAAIEDFRSGRKDVLVATDVAGKGLDFPDIKHVINFDMPKEIEDYVHRIGRTGRSGKTGVATTFINREVPETTLLDLKHLLIEAKQKLPPVLLTLEDPAGIGAAQQQQQQQQQFGGGGAGPDDGIKGCGYCGGFGHRILNCPKLQSANRAKHGRNAYGYDSMSDFSSI